MLVLQNPRPVTQGPLPALFPPALHCLAQAPKTLRGAGWLIFEELPLRASFQVKCLRRATKHQIFSELCLVELAFGDLDATEIDLPAFMTHINLK